MTTNPAHRLYGIIQDFFDNKIASDSQKLSHTLGNMFGVPQHDMVGKLECLTELNRLVIITNSSLHQTGLNIGAHLLSVTNDAANKLNQLHLAMSMSDVRKILGGAATSLNGLETCGLLLDASNLCQPEIPEEFLASLLAKAKELEESLLSSDTSKDIKLALLPILEALQKAIKLIRIKGSEALTDIYHQAFGNTAAFKQACDSGQVTPKEADRNAWRAWMEVVGDLHKIVELADKTKVIGAPLLEGAMNLLEFMP